MIDPEGTGQIRIIRRVNLRTIVLVVKELFRELRKNPDKVPHSIIHLSQSLSHDMSDNLKSFPDFSLACMEGTFELRIVG